MRADERNPLSGQPQRIALSVPPLVMGRDDFAGHLQKIRGAQPTFDFSQALVADLRMELHPFAFFAGQGTWLPEDRIFHAHFADVVQPRRLMPMSCTKPGVMRAENSGR